MRSVVIIKREREDGTEEIFEEKVESSCELRAADDDCTRKKIVIQTQYSEMHIDQKDNLKPLFLLVIGIPVVAFIIWMALSFASDRKPAAMSRIKEFANPLLSQNTKSFLHQPNHESHKIFPRGKAHAAFIIEMSPIETGVLEVHIGANQDFQNVVATWKLGEGIHVTESLASIIGTMASGEEKVLRLKYEVGSGSKLMLLEVTGENSSGSDANQTVGVTGAYDLDVSPLQEEQAKKVRELFEAREKGEVNRGKKQNGSADAMSVMGTKPFVAPSGPPKFFQ